MNKMLRDIIGYQSRQKPIDKVRQLDLIFESMMICSENKEEDFEDWASLRAMFYNLVDNQDLMKHDRYDRDELDTLTNKLQGSQVFCKYLFRKILKDGNNHD